MDALFTQYDLYAGLDGLISYQYTANFDNSMSADKMAYQLACDMYDKENPSILHNIVHIYCIEHHLTEEELFDYDREKIYDIYEEIRDEHIEYKAILTIEDDRQENLIFQDDGSSSVSC